MTTSPLSHKVGNVRMNRALAEHAQYVRVAGHAGVWHYDGPAHVLGDEEVFEHPSLVLVHQVADPERVAVVEASDLTPFTPADVSVPPIAV